MEGDGDLGGCVETGLWGFGRGQELKPTTPCNEISPPDLPFT